MDTHTRNRKQLAEIYCCVFLYVALSTGVILYNEYVLSTYFNFPFPVTLTIIHMAFSSIVAFLLVRVFKIWTPVEMTKRIYVTCVIPISAFFAVSLWFANTAYLYISVTFIQMLKSLMPVATFLIAVAFGTNNLRCDLFWNMILISFGVLISTYGEIQFNLLGAVLQVTGIFAEALRLVLTQVLLQSRGLRLNPITTVYYIAPCSLFFLCIPWYFLEKPSVNMSKIRPKFWTLLSNSVCALILNLSTFLVINRSGAVTIRVAGVVKDCFLIALSTALFPDATITALNLIGYAIALFGAAMYHFLQARVDRSN